MATSSLCNFLSFLSPSSSQPPPQSQPKKPPNQLSPPTLSSNSLPTLSSSSTSTQGRRNTDGITPVTADNGFSSSSDKDFMSVVCPSLAYANTLFFKSAYNVQVIVGEDEPEEVLLRRFRREVMRAGVITECKRRRFFENSQDEKKRRTRDAAKRNKRRRTPYKPREFDKPEATKTKNADEQEDNWDLPSGVLPY